MIYRKILIFVWGLSLSKFCLSEVVEVTPYQSLEIDVGSLGSHPTADILLIDFVSVDNFSNDLTVSLFDKDTFLASQTISGRPNDSQGNVRNFAFTDNTVYENVWLGNAANVDLSALRNGLLNLKLIFSGDGTFQFDLNAQMGYQSYVTVGILENDRAALTPYSVVMNDLPVTEISTVVPLQASAWLFLSAAGGLVGAKRLSS